MTILRSDNAVVLITINIFLYSMLGMSESFRTGTFPNSMPSILLPAEAGDEQLLQDISISQEDGPVIRTRAKCSPGTSYPTQPSQAQKPVTVCIEQDETSTSQNRHK